MKKNPIYQALNVLFNNTRKSSLNILKLGIIEKGWLRMTDLDHELQVFVGDIPKESGLIDIKLLIETEDYPAAINSVKDISAEDFPVEIKKEFKNIPFLNFYELADLLPGVSMDSSRACLQNIFIDGKNKKYAATDGIVFFQKNISKETKYSFMLDPLSIKIINCFNGNILKNELCNTNEFDFIKVSGKGWQLISKELPSKGYPDYTRVIPDRAESKKVLWDTKLIKEMKMFLEKSIPFVNKKTYLIRFKNNKGLVINKELSFCKETTFSKDILPLEKDQMIGINAYYLLNRILKIIGNNSVSVSVGERITQIILFEGKDFLCGLMPLEIMED